MNQRQVDRFRESRERRDRAIAKLKDLLLREAWETASQVHDRQSRAHPPPVVVSEPPPSRAGLSPAAKQAITVAAMAIGTAIVSALSASGASKQHESPPPSKPPTTQPGP